MKIECEAFVDFFKMSFSLSEINNSNQFGFFSEKNIEPVYHSIRCRMEIGVVFFPKWERVERFEQSVWTPLVPIASP
jgi:hypothetical protein